ncbi:MAG: response regulator [Spirochaetes bacterium]|jgi:DNA-binding response OmpR family regulator|nr:response regulator [Spirochaetota bacterium]
MADTKLIFVIDDDPDILDSITAILTAEGFAVETATSGEDGIAKLSKIKPALILCDMMMERIDAGSKVAEEIKKSGTAVPVYLLSSIGAATASNVEIDRLGFDGVFQKPVAPAHLVSTIKKALKI